jgi:hypothetical protein
MPQLARITRPTGSLTARLIPRHGFYTHGLPRETPLRFKLRTLWLETMLRARLGLKGLYRGLIHASGVVGVGRLYATVIRATGDVEHLGLVSTKVVTDAGVAYIVDDWDGGASTIDDFNYHGCGTGTNAEAAGDTTLQTESTTALNPDNTRATGTKSQPSANIMRSVGTVTFDAGAAITEHGLFSDVDVSQGTLLDRSVFTAINVVSADSIQFTYSLTLSSGG